MGIRLEGLAPAVAAKAGLFLADLETAAGGSLHSLYVVGSAATADWDERRSDVNTLVMLRGMDLAVLKAVAPLGRRYRGRGIAAPLVMDVDYVHRSLDVFPMEFLELKLIHETVLGEDLLAGLSVLARDLRHQCEREVKVRLVGLRRAYLASLGEAKPLREALERFPAGMAPLARAILFLQGKEPPRRKAEAFAALAAAAGPDAAVFGELLSLREGRGRADAAAVGALFERCYRATERLGRTLDALQP